MSRWTMTVAAALLGTVLALSALLSPEQAAAPDLEDELRYPPGQPKGAPSATDGPAAAPGEVIVRFRSSADGGDRAAARARADVSFEESLPVKGMQVVEAGAGTSVREAVSGLERSRDVVYAEPNFIRRATARPNDRYFAYEWGLHNTGQTVAGTAGTVDADVDGPEAWDLTTGSAGVRVAVVDSGVDTAHPDLSPNVFADPAEPQNGVDDDGDGLVDDRSGWDFVEDDATPQDADGHGTHVAGTIGARGNDGTGVAGVSWNAGLIPVRVLGPGGSGTVADVIEGYRYAARNGARIVNASLGSNTSSRAERDAIAAASNVLFVVAAGNDGLDADSNGSYPCNYALDNLICVAATDQADRLASFSNYGARNVDLAAPGVTIASTYPNNDYVYLDGTSMATPHVAGAAALALARRPSATVAELRSALLSTADPKSGLSGRVVTGGRLNAVRAVQEIAGGSDASAGTAPAPAPPPTGAVAPTNPPTAAPAPSTAPDGTPPTVALSAQSAVRLATARRGGLAHRVTCSEACTLRSDVTVDRRTAKRLRLGSGARSVVVAKATGGVGGAAASTLRARLTARAKSRLRASTLVTLSTRAVDPAGNPRTVRKQIRLR